MKKTTYTLFFFLLLASAASGQIAKIDLEVMEAAISIDDYNKIFILDDSATYEKLSSNWAEIVKDGTTIDIYSDQEILEEKIPTEFYGHKWSYRDKGFEIVTFDNPIIQKGRYICDSTKKQKTKYGWHYDVCVKYPSLKIWYNETTILTEYEQLAFGLKNNKVIAETWREGAIITILDKYSIRIDFEKAYDPLTLDYSEGFQGCYSFDTDYSDDYGSMQTFNNNGCQINSSQYKLGSGSLYAYDCYLNNVDVSNNITDFPFSWAYWVYPENQNNDKYQISLDKGSLWPMASRGYNKQFQIMLQGTSYTNNGDARSDDWAFIGIVIESDHYWLYTYSASQGEKIKNGTHSKSWNSAYDELLVGTLSEGLLADYAKSDIDELMIWNTNLSMSMMTELRNGTTGTTCGELIDSISGGAPPAGPAACIINWTDSSPANMSQYPSYTDTVTFISTWDLASSNATWNGTSFGDDGTVHNITVDVSPSTNLELYFNDTCPSGSSSGGSINISVNQTYDFNVTGNVSHQHYYNVTNINISVNTTADHRGMGTNCSYIIDDNATVVMGDGTTNNGTFTVTPKANYTLYYQCNWNDQNEVWTAWATVNATPDEGACSPTWTNTSWILNATSACTVSDNQSINYTLYEYDSSVPQCSAQVWMHNSTGNQSCNYCSYSIETETGNWTNASYSCGTRISYSWDINYTTCCNITLQDSDCYAGNATHQDNATFYGNYSSTETSTCAGDWGDEEMMGIAILLGVILFYIHVWQRDLDKTHKVMKLFAMMFNLILIVIMVYLAGTFASNGAAQATVNILDTTYWVVIVGTIVIAFYFLVVYAGQALKALSGVSK